MTREWVVWGLGMDRTLKMTMALMVAWGPLVDWGLRLTLGLWVIWVTDSFKPSPPLSSVIKNEK